MHFSQSLHFHRFLVTAKAKERMLLPTADIRKPFRTSKAVNLDRKRNLENGL